MPSLLREFLGALFGGDGHTLLFNNIVLKEFININFFLVLHLDQLQHLKAYESITRSLNKLGEKFYFKSKETSTKIINIEKDEDKFIRLIYI